jgi:hypothetical protein
VAESSFSVNPTAAAEAAAAAAAAVAFWRLMVR